MTRVSRFTGPDPLRRAGLIVTAVLVGLVMIVGCRGHLPVEEPPVPSSTPSDQGLAEPISRQDALDSATATISSDQAAIFAVLDGSADPEILKSYEAGDYLLDTESFLQIYWEDENLNGVSGEAGIWHPHFEGASVESLEDLGRSVQFGLVRIAGCFEPRWEFVQVVDDGTPSRIGQMFPEQMTLQYDVSRGGWRITDWADLRGLPDAPDCAFGA